MKQSFPQPIAELNELEAIIVNECQESMVDLQDRCPDILCEYRRKDSKIQNILVRQKIANMLMEVQKKLKKHNPNMQLLIVEGYRSPEYQEQYFLKELINQCRQNPNMGFEALIRKTHNLVALPSVAGHPTGGAIDVTIACKGKEIDMGGAIADFSNPGLITTYSSCATAIQQKNRILLHDLMLEEGFCPFYGEWWHYSYGDREWAAFYGQSRTLYGPVNQGQ